MKYIYAIIIALLIFALSCSILKFTNIGSAKSDSSIVNTERNDIKVDFTYQVDKDETFQIFFRETNEEFSHAKVKTIKVKGSSEFRTESVLLPISSSHMRLDIGLNKKQGKVRIKDFSLSTKEVKPVSFNAEQISQKFKFNHFVNKTEVKDGAINFLVQEKNGKYKPYIENIALQDILGLKKPTKLSINFQIDKEDTLQVFYKKIGGKYSEKNSKPLFVKGSPEFQTSVVTIPAQFDIARIDISKNKAQKKVQIQNVEFSKDHSESKTFQGKSLLKISNPNEFIGKQKVSNGALVLTTKTVENRYDPGLYNFKLEEIFKSKISPQIAKAQNKFSFIQLAISLLLSLIFLGLFFTGKILIPSKGFLLFPIIFCAMLLLPFIQENTEFAYKAKKISTEKRKLAVKPDFQLSKKYFQEYENYYNDHFGFRDKMIRWSKNLKYYIFGISTNANQALWGKDDWLFLNNKLMQTFYTNRGLYSPKAVEKLCRKWRYRLIKNESENIKYYKTFYPNKHSIYKEMMSDKMLNAIIDTISKTDQLIQEANAMVPPFQIIDHRDKLLAAKKDHLIYFSNDTHWNAYGAFIAYNNLFSIISKDFPEVKPKELKDFKISWETKFFPGDLVGLMGLKHDILKNKRPTFTLKQKKLTEYTTLPSKGFPPKTAIHQNNHCNNDLTLLVFRDSFTEALTPYFSLHFKKVVYIWTDYNQEIVDKVKPDLIIDGHVERDMQVK